MADTVTELALGTFLEVRSGPSPSDPFVKLAQVTNLTPPSDTFDEEDVTHLESEGGVKEFEPGLTDPGEMPLKLLHVPGSDTDVFILSWKAARERRETRLTFPSGRKQLQKAFVKTYVPDELTPGARMRSSLGLRCSGLSTFEG